MKKTPQSTELSVMNTPNSGSRHSAHLGRLFLLGGVLLTFIIAGACSDEKGTANITMPGDGGEGGEFPVPEPPEECNVFEFQGETYDCSQLDRCDTSQANFQYRLACCECDPYYCKPDPECDYPDDPIPEGPTETCMTCHNGSDKNDYGGPGMSNPHHFPGAAYVLCSGCHGGDPQGDGKSGSHVPVPPEIGGNDPNQVDNYLINNEEAYFNRITLAGIDKMPDYNVDGKTYNALDYLQFINPGDLRVVSKGRACGTAGCHDSKHVTWVTRNVLATEAGFFSGATYTAGIDNYFDARDGWYEDTAADYGFRDITDPAFAYNPAYVGEVPSLKEQPEWANFYEHDGVSGIFDQVLAAELDNDVYQVDDGVHYPNQVIADSDLAKVYMEQVSITCGDCHLGSAGANNRYADFRSSGCTACHMQYSPDGRSRSTDPNVNKVEPANPDAIQAPERAHILSHQIVNVAKLLPNGTFLRGTDDLVCAGCHQGSNRTVLQYWGIRLDQNQDLANGFQYPAQPASFTDTAQDTRLYDPAVNNATFNGRNAAQHILTEDYDGDGRDDTPPDVHYEAGLACIDCHGSRDLHGGSEGEGGNIVSRRDQGNAIRCVSCHGTVGSYVQTQTCTDYYGETKNCAVDSKGNPIRHVTQDANGDFYLTSRRDGSLHYVVQTRDTVVNTGKVHPLKAGQLIYSPKASYAMGRADGNAATGTGPIQANDGALIAQGFSHMDNMDCVGCHASWTNTCVGCHLETGYNSDPNQYFFSNITGERIMLQQNNAGFTYINPWMMELGVSSRNQISTFAANSAAFYRYTDLNGDTSNVFLFTDRNGNGNNPNRSDGFGASMHTPIRSHSIRGKVNAQQEGPRYCVACHMTTDGINNFGAEYDVFRTAMANGDWASLDFNLLAQHFGQNTGNQLNTPFWSHMVAGLGTGLFLFDENGCPVNPLDANANRQVCADGAPADNFNPANVVYNLDRAVNADGQEAASNIHPIEGGQTSQLRDGSYNPKMAGPLGRNLVEMLSDPNVGRVLNSWIDANGAPGGNAADYIQ